MSKVVFRAGVVVILLPHHFLRTSITTPPRGGGALRGRVQRSCTKDYATGAPQVRHGPRHRPATDVPQVDRAMDCATDFAMDCRDNITVFLLRSCLCVLHVLWHGPRHRPAMEDIDRPNNRRNELHGHKFQQILYYNRTNTAMSRPIGTVPYPFH